MTKSVPRATKAYHENIIRSPLMKLSNYPASIVKRITTSRGRSAQRNKR